MFGCRIPTIGCNAYVFDSLTIIARVRPTGRTTLMTAPRQLMLTLESSCDETAAAVVDSDLQVLSSVVATQDDLHQRFGGVVPEIAARAHLERILPVIDEALRKAAVTLQDLQAIGVVTQPGLVGS